MSIAFPKQTVKHRRKTKQVAEPVFFINGKFLNWNEAQKIYFDVQAVYDRMDVEQEVEYRFSEGDYTAEQLKDIKTHMGEIVDRFRSVLDDLDGGNWNNTLGSVLWRFNNRKEKPYLW